MRRNGLYETQIASFVDIVLSAGQNYMRVENEMTNNGPMWVQNGLLFFYRPYIGPVFGHYAQIPYGTHLTMLAGI